MACTPSVKLWSLPPPPGLRERSHFLPCYHVVVSLKLYLAIKEIATNFNSNIAFSFVIYEIRLEKVLKMQIRFELYLQAVLLNLEGMFPLKVYMAE